MFTLYQWGNLLLVTDYSFQTIYRMMNLQSFLYTCTKIIPALNIDERDTVVIGNRPCWKPRTEKKDNWERECMLRCVCTCWVQLESSQQNSFHQSPTRYSDWTVTAKSLCNCRQHGNYTVDQLCVVTMLLAVVSSDYTVTIQSLCSHCAKY